MAIVLARQLGKSFTAGSESCRPSGRSRALAPQERSREWSNGARRFQL